MRSIQVRANSTGQGEMLLMDGGHVVRTISTEVSYEAIQLLAKEYRFATVIDIGCGRGEHADALRWIGAKVTTVDPVFEADYKCDLFTLDTSEQYDVVWCSHVLEHQRNIGVFLDRLIALCKPGGILTITVPPEITPYFLLCHPNQFSAGSLIYHLIMAGIDCREARALTYGYNVSVVARNVKHGMSPQSWAYEGECAQFFPPETRRNGNQLFGPASSINWTPTTQARPHGNAHL